MIIRRKGMNRAGLVKYIADNYVYDNGNNITKKDALRYIETVADAIIRASVEDGAVDIANFGSFKIKEIPPKEIYSPFHNKKIITEPKKKVIFYPYSAYTELLKE